MDKEERIDKTIEYIETIQPITQPYGKTLMQQILNDLLEILKGDNNAE